MGSDVRPLALEIVARLERGVVGWLCACRTCGSDAADTCAATNAYPCYLQEAACLRNSRRCRSEDLVSDRQDGGPPTSRLLDACDGAPTRPASYDPRPAGLNIALPLAVADAGTSSCSTSQCSTSLPFTTRKISTATIGFGPHPT